MIEKYEVRVMRSQLNIIICYHNKIIPTRRINFPPSKASKISLVNIHREGLIGWVMGSGRILLELGSQLSIKI